MSRLTVPLLLFVDSLLKIQITQTLLYSPLFVQLRPFSIPCYFLTSITERRLLFHTSNFRNCCLNVTETFSTTFYGRSHPSPHKLLQKVSGVYLFDKKIRFTDSSCLQNVQLFSCVSVCEYSMCDTLFCSFPLEKTGDK